MKYLSPTPESVRLADPVFAPRQEANRAATIPASIRFCEETHSIDALRLDWKPGMDWKPHFFWDSDVAKVLEGMARDLRLRPDSKRTTTSETSPSRFASPAGAGASRSP